ncbi:hypothetical protein [Actinokineospora enzanensis]|uniref:hypothetical protein n=1 Tax=Actinokineospora enzanensis TaxID=155975 RepID=UPI00035F2115|nr:hypothetical protein [Actinokineospora enzanensis]
MSDNVHDLLRLALDGEPPLDIDRDAVFADGKRRLRRRRQAAVGGVTLAVAVGVVGTAALSSGVFAFGPQVTPATTGTPVVSITESPRPSLPAPMPTAPGTSPASRVPSMTTTTFPMPPSAQGMVVLNDRFKDWPAGVHGVKGSARPLFELAGGGGFTADVLTTTGRRVLQVRVYFTAAVQHSMECFSAQNGTPLPNCTRSTGPGGAVLRMNRENMDAKQHFPAILQVIADRADGVTVEVMDTAGTDPGSRLDPVLTTGQLVDIATDPKLQP